MSTTGTPTPQRAGVRRAVDAHQAAQRLYHGVVVRRAAERPIGAEAANPAVGQAREAFAQRLLIADGPALKRADLEVLNQHVGICEHFQHNLAPFGLRQVDHDIALVVVQAVIVGGGAVAGKGWAPGAGFVASGRLDLDDLGAVVSQDLPAVCVTKHTRQVEHLQAGQSAKGG